MFLPPLLLNEQALHIDRKLPGAKYKSNITPPKDVKENQLKDGATFRSVKQKKIKDDMNSLQSEEYTRKMYIKKTWKSVNDVQKQSYMNMLSNYNLPEYKSLIDYIKRERSWWKSTYSSGLTVSILETVFSDYTDELGEHIKRYEDALSENEILGAALIEQRKNAKPVEEGKALEDGMNMDIDWSKITPEKGNELANSIKESKKMDDPFKRTLWDDVNDSWSIIGGFLSSLIWIIVGLRFGSSITNEYYYLKMPYKILMFVYTLIFTPVLIPYFIFKTLRSWLYPVIYPPFIYRCFLPLYESEDPTLNNSWFTYILDSATIADKFAKLKVVDDANRNILKDTIIYGLQTELAQFTLVAAKAANVEKEAKKKQDAADTAATADT